MKIKKSIKLLLLISITGIIMVGCSNSLGKNIPNGFTLVEEENGGIMEIRNNNTGVHYYYINGTSLCPVYLFNGQVKVTTDIENDRNNK